MATYEELVGDTTNPGIIRDWANRDTDVVSDSQVQQALRWAADKCYRKLRVPSLEISRQFTVTEDDYVSSEYYDSVHQGTDFILMPVPQDLIDVIHIRTACGRVFNEKVDRRTFFDDLAFVRTDAFWTRLGDDYFIGGNLKVGDVLYIHYYRRLPALDAKYVALADTWNSDASFFTVDSDTPVTDDTLTNADGVLWFAADTTSTTAPTLEAADARTDDAPVGFQVTGVEAFNWLRDENERILIFGALMEIFAYLNEPEQLARYLGMFETEIEELNREEMMRRTRGGNVQVSFASRLL